MDKLLIKKDFAKLTIFRELIYSYPKDVPLNYFSDYLNLSKRSTLSLIADLNHDFEHIMDLPTVRVKENKQAYFIKTDTAENFEIHALNLQAYYLKNSIQFNILLTLLNNYFYSMAELADYLYISSTHLYRQIADLKSILVAFKIDIIFTGKDAKTNFIGSQKHLKTFYWIFYWAYSQGIFWPLEDKMSITELHEKFQLKIDNPTNKPSKTRKLELLFFLSYLDSESSTFSLSTDIKDIALLLKEVNDVSAFTAKYITKEDELLFLNLISRILVSELDTTEDKIQIHKKISSLKSPIVTQSTQLTESIFDHFLSLKQASTEERSIAFYYIFIYHLYIHLLDADITVFSKTPVSLNQFSNKSERFKLLEKEIVQFFKGFIENYNIEIEDIYLNGYYFLISSIIEYTKPTPLKIYIQYSRHFAGENIIKNKILNMFGEENISIIDNINEATIVVSDSYEVKRPDQIFFFITELSRPEVWQNLIYLILNELFNKNFKFDLFQ